MVLLREFINVLLEDSGLLKKWAEKSEHNIEKALASAGYMPIPKGKQQRWWLTNQFEPTSFVAAGAYAKVYEVTTESGKRAVAKVTKSKRDIDAYELAKEIRSRAPQNVAKHIIEVLDIVELDNVYSAIVCEFLAPLDAATKSSVFGGAGEHDAKRNAQELAVDHEMREKIIRDAVTSVMRVEIPLMDEIIDSGASTTGWGSLVKNIAMQEFEVGEDYVSQNVYNIARKATHALYGQKLQRLAPNEQKKIVDRTILLITHALGGYAFPTTSHGEARVELKGQAKSLFKALKWLKENEGWGWEDVHGDNVMVRPSTGELVVSDVGMFKLA